MGRHNLEVFHISVFPLALRQRQWSITPLSLQNPCLQLHACWLSPPILCARPDIMCCDHILTQIIVKSSYNNAPYCPAADTTAPSNAFLLSFLSCRRAAPNFEPQKTLMELVVLWGGGGGGGHGRLGHW